MLFNRGSYLQTILNAHVCACTLVANPTHLRTIQSSQSSQWRQDIQIIICGYIDFLLSREAKMHQHKLNPSIRSNCMIAKASREERLQLIWLFHFFYIIIKDALICSFFKIFTMDEISMCNVKGIASDKPIDNDYRRLCCSPQLCSVLASFLAHCFGFTGRSFNVLVQSH